MTISIAPKEALTPTPPAVGIFWRVDGVLVIDRSTLNNAEPYGDCITHAAGHFKRWEEWRALTGARRASPIALHQPNTISGPRPDRL